MQDDKRSLIFILSFSSLVSFVVFVPLCVKYVQTKHQHLSNKVNVEIVSLTMENDDGGDRCNYIGSYNANQYCLVYSDHNKNPCRFVIGQSYLLYTNGNDCYDYNYIQDDATDLLVWWVVFLVVSIVAFSFACSFYLEIRKERRFQEFKPLEEENHEVNSLEQQEVCVSDDYVQHGPSIALEEIVLNPLFETNEM